MKKITYSFLFLFIVRLASADEGMWLVHLIGEKTYADMVKKGLKLSKEQLYSMNKNSIKDAIVLFGGGCTAEIVSKEGLLFTNHHCGYGNIAAASTVEHNHLKDGFWAKNKAEEIACPGLSVQFLVKIEDVSDSVNARIKDVKPDELLTKLGGILQEMQAEASKNSGYEVRVSSFFRGNQFLQFSYERFSDIRLVGTPPESIGKFGGDTDNWEWPRHTGDFSVFRIYMAADGKPAEYSKDNVPYKPKHFLPVSVKGVSDGDYAMIFGYPAGTNRYETSYGVKLKIDIENPSIVNLRDARLKLMFAEMVKDPDVKIKLASSYAGIANYWKFFDGESKQLIKHNVIDRKEKDEKDFENWAKGKTEYAGLFNDIKETYDTWRPYAQGRIYLYEGILGSPLMAFSYGLRNLDAAMSKPGAKPEDISKAAAQVSSSYEKFIKNENIASDRNILGVVLRMFYNDVATAQQPTAFYQQLRSKYGELDQEETYKKYARDVFANTFILNKEKWDAFISKPDTAVLHSDPAWKTAMSFADNYTNNYSSHFSKFNAANFAHNRRYQKGILEMRKGTVMYPDANQTMRISYGNVKSYSPRDAVNYSEICTMKGVMEKYKPGDHEFDMPESFVKLARSRDFGQYIDKKANDLVVNFITTNDITGGNSGSPVINAKGELIGLAFDGNYEALSHKIAFDADLNRTICLDVRYLLFVMDKYGNAKNIIDELTLSKN